MTSATVKRVPSLDEASTFSPQQVVDLARSLNQEVEALRHQLDWFKRQVFGQKSERRIVADADGQMSLGEDIRPEQTAVPPVPVERPVAAHTRRATTAKPGGSDDAIPFFDATRVPMEVVELAAPEAAGLAPEEFEVVSYKDSYRLAQRPGSYVVLHYRRPVIKLKATQALVCANAPAGVIDGSRADVSFIAGLLIDKFAYHLPFYR